MSNAYCQPEVSNWYFGTFAGMNFSAAGVASPLLNGALNTNEGSSSISDAIGDLLFYTDGVTVWNSNHVQMPNGDNLMGDVSSTQSALIIKQPFSNHLYYLFTVDELGGLNGFRYSIVDMNLDGGLGDITAQKNILIQNHVTEKLCGVMAANDSDIWVMVHDFGTDGFYAYKLTAAGLTVTPVVSNAGTVHDSALVSTTYGYMKFSPDGHKIAVAIGYLNIAEVLNFDSQTGIVSNPITFNIGEHCYGIEFSPDNSKLYLSHYSTVTQNFQLDQFDLSAGTPADIIASQQPIAYAYDPDEIRALQLGPDGKIYVAKKGTGALSVINKPDSLGSACNYTDNSFSLGGNVVMLGLPNFVSSFFTEKSKPVTSFYSLDSALCVNNCTSFTDASTNVPNTWSWFFEGGTPDTSTQQNPGLICYSAPGVYDVTLITGNGQGEDTLFYPAYITINAVPSPPTVTQFGAVFNCSPASTYQWYLDSIAITGATNQVYTAIQSGNYYVVVTAEGGCASSSTVIAYFPEGINEMLSNKINIYPNPVGDQLTVIGYLVSVNSIEIKDLLGKTIRSVTVKPQSRKMVIDVSSLPSGIYFVEIKTVTTTSVAKFLKQ